MNCIARPLKRLHYRELNYEIRGEGRRCVVTETTMTLTERCDDLASDIQDAYAEGDDIALGALLLRTVDLLASAGYAIAALQTNIQALRLRLQCLSGEHSEEGGAK